MTEIDRTWHLAENEAEVMVTEFELHLWRVFYGFLRWQEECENSVNGTDLTGNELAVLHIIRMKGRPKLIQDIGRLLNREDTFNIQYSIRKLVKMGLIEKAQSTTNKKSNVYQITQAGIENTDRYTRTRKSILIDMLLKDENLNLDEITKTLIKLKGIYEEADRAATSYATSTDKPVTEDK